MKTDAPSLALVGCGAFAERFYLPALAQYPEVMERLVLIDRDPERLERLGNEYGPSRFGSDYRAFVQDVDAAIISVPHHLHHSVSIDFLSEGVHVLCEKPLATSPDDAHEMVNLAENKNVALCVNNTRRLYPTYQKIKSLISEGQIGELVSIDYVEGGTFSWPTTTGFRFTSASGARGVLLDKGAHILDLICWWLGKRPQLIDCRTDSFKGPEGVVNVKFASGRCVGNTRISWLNKQDSRYLIRGDSGSIEGVVDDIHNFYLTIGSHKNKVTLKSAERTYWDLGRTTIDNYLDVISEGAKPLIPARAVLPSIEWIDECYRTARQFGLPWYESWMRDEAPG